MASALHQSFILFRWSSSSKESSFCQLWLHFYLYCCKQRILSPYYAGTKPSRKDLV